MYVCIDLYRMYVYNYLLHANPNPNPNPNPTCTGQRATPGPNGSGICLYQSWRTKGQAKAKVTMMS